MGFVPVPETAKQDESDISYNGINCKLKIMPQIISTNVTLDHKTSRTGIFVAIANNCMGQNYRFFFYAKYN